MTDIRIDRVKLGKVSKTPEGYLKGHAIVTRTGVFKYTNMDGTSRYELRDPKDVLTNESLETLKSLPITNDHPSDLVTSENASILTVGMTGETIKIEDGFVGVSLNITHKDAIEAISSGKQELSAGYRVDLIPEVGEYNGESYTHRQTNISYNHIAIVEMGRAGRVARLNLDGAFMQCEEIKEIKEVMTIKQDDNILSEIEDLAKTVVQETTGVDIPKVVEEVEDVEKAVEVAVTDSVEAFIDNRTTEDAELDKVKMDSLIIEKTKQRVALLTKAASVINVDSLIEKSEREIMEAVISSKLNRNMDFANKSDDYVLGRFDSVIEDSRSDVFKKQMQKTDAKPVEAKPTTYMEAVMKQQGRF